LGGSNGGCISGEPLETISGSAASAVFATVAPAMATPAPLKNLLREIMIIS
jgi:hypothetical protein